jgi:hypothetical protein
MGMNLRRGLWRESATALAVLAIYMLTLLAPLHQARATQLDLAALGYATTDAGWVLCTPEGATDPDRDAIPISKCPAAGIGKKDLAAPPPEELLLAVGLHWVAVQAIEPASIERVPVPARPVGSRAPPAVA